MAAVVFIDQVWLETVIEPCLFAIYLDVW